MDYRCGKIRCRTSATTLVDTRKLVLLRSCLIARSKSSHSRSAAPAINSKVPITRKPACSATHLPAFRPLEQSLPLDGLPSEWRQLRLDREAKPEAARDLPGTSLRLRSPAGHLHIYTHLHTFTHTFTHTHLHTHLHTHIYTHLHTFTHIYTPESAFENIGKIKNGQVTKNGCIADNDHGVLAERRFLRSDNTSSRLSEGQASCRDENASVSHRSHALEGGQPLHGTAGRNGKHLSQSLQAPPATGFLRCPLTGRSRDRECRA